MSTLDGISSTLTALVNHDSKPLEISVKAAHPLDFMEFAITPGTLLKPHRRGVSWCLANADGHSSPDALSAHQPA
jgi:hypothetical protein